MREGGLRYVVHLLDEVPTRFAFWNYYEAFRREPYSFLLDSALGGAPHGRFSFMGGDPELVYEAKRLPTSDARAVAHIAVTRRRDESGAPLSAPRMETRIADPFDDFEAVFAPYRVPSGELEPSPIPFLGGAIGYFGYDCNHFIDRLPDRAKGRMGLPDICMMIVDGVLAHDHVSGRTYVSAIGRADTLDAAANAARRRRDALVSRVAAAELHGPAVEIPFPQGLLLGKAPPAASGSRAAYERVVERAKQHIRAGDCYQVCTSHCIETRFRGDPWDLYRELRRLSPAPFAAYLRLPFAHVVSSSPERFLRLDRNRFVESRPIKGTRPRGASPTEDAALRNDLATSAKDRAENVMIVDLVRSDLGRVCENHSVHVVELMTIEEYSAVFQLVSTVRGRLRKDFTAFALLTAAFPGGSMTGAPKVQAMKIIDSLEPAERGIYAGALGYLDVSGAMDLSIVIRTAVVKDGLCSFSVGGAVLADSEPESEYLETMHKARALFAALEATARR